MYLAHGRSFYLKCELPDTWIAEVKKDVPYEDAPILLWDRDDKSEVQLLSHPEIAKKMIDYNKDLKRICDEEYIPRIISSV